MGFNLAEGVSREGAVAALLEFARRSLKCAHVELRDRRLSSRQRESFDTLEIDLEPAEDELFARMTSACRRCIRKAEKEHVTIEEASDLEFADEYYAQLLDVFAKQSLSPTYGVEVVRALVGHAHPGGNVLLLRARNPEGKCIATGIFPGMNGSAYFWGGASWRSDQILRPNEAVFWYAMRYWKQREVTALDLGAGDYKRKYGVRDVSVPHLVHSSLPGLGAMRALVKLRHSERLRRFVPARFS
jgi:CelD/BcsL family acetyltransferase involved in cellulose biosynthesis